MSDIYVLITVPFPEPLVERLKVVSPRLQIHVHPAPRSEDLPEELLPDIEILYTLWAMPDPEAVPELRWIQFHFAGIERLADHPLLSSEVKVTTLSGAAVPQMAEFALMSMLALGRKLPVMMADPPEVRWDENRYRKYEPTELRDSTVGILGYGSIGREVARLCREFGAKVLAIKHDLKHLQDEGYTLEGTGDPGGDIPDRLYPPQALRSMVPLCDFLVVTVPLTSETRGMVSSAIFEAMKTTAHLVDISRGGVVDHGALVEALATEKLAGAALDVYPAEPLPETSPLWELPNVILSPHVAGASEHYYERAAALFAENLHRYLSERPLLNLYHPEKGY
ncbi:MAG: D-2-hydroxyacid dehydrogenase [Anaerolineales bacterium]|nr:D-2-hydroxyacid dehydrogenase [Anaerolineales bacterium]